MNSYENDPTIYIRHHLTTALAVPIAAAEMKGDAQGTIGFYFHENIDADGKPSDKVLAVTNHHVLCKAESDEYDFRDEDSPPQKIRVCGHRRFERGLQDIKAAIEHHEALARATVDSIASIETQFRHRFMKPCDKANLQAKQQKLDQQNAVVAKIEQFYADITTAWGDIADRDIGALEFTPPLTVNGGYTQDWATIRLDANCFKPNFQGNVIDLGTQFSPYEFEKLMNLSTPEKTNTASLSSIAPTNSETPTEPSADPDVRWPTHGLLRVKGALSSAELADPTSVDNNNDPWFPVLKDGCTTDLTIGRCVGYTAFRSNSIGIQSTEVTIFNHNDRTLKPFSSRGDSGSLIVNGKGQMVGLLHTGMPRNQLMSGSGDWIALATPAWRLLEWIKEVYPNADFDRENW